MLLTGSSPNARNLKVLEANRRLILLWDKCAGNNDGEQLIGYSGLIKEDGAAPNGKVWKMLNEASFWFPGWPQFKAGKSFSYSVVVVPRHYTDFP